MKAASRPETAVEDPHAPPTGTRTALRRLAVLTGRYAVVVTLPNAILTGDLERSLGTVLVPIAFCLPLVGPLGEPPTSDAFQQAYTSLTTRFWIFGVTFTLINAAWALLLFLS